MNGDECHSSTKGFILAKKDRKAKNSSITLVREPIALFDFF